MPYALPSYTNTLNQTKLAESFKQLQYRAPKLVSGALHFTSREHLTMSLVGSPYKEGLNWKNMRMFQVLKRNFKIFYLLDTYHDPKLELFRFVEFYGPQLFVPGH